MQLFYLFFSSFNFYRLLVFFTGFFSVKLVQFSDLVILMKNSDPNLILIFLIFSLFNRHCEENFDSFVIKGRFTSILCQLECAGWMYLVEFGFFFREWRMSYVIIGAPAVTMKITIIGFSAVIFPPIVSKRVLFPHRNTDWTNNSISYFFFSFQLSCVFFSPTSCLR